MTAGASALLVMSMVAALAWYGFSHGLLAWRESSLHVYQIRKIDSAPRAEIVLLGDSSLGNTIDARRWTAQLGYPVLSLALTGQYGYAGSLNMLRRVLRRWTPRLVVIVQTVDIAARNPSYLGEVVTAEEPGDVSVYALLAALPTLANSHAPMGMLRYALGSAPPVDASLVARDYIVQGPSLLESGRALMTRERLVREEVRPTNGRYLREAAKLCAAHRVRCVYMHGPLVQPLCGQVAPLVRAVDDLIAANGLQTVPGTPVCIPLAEIGNAEDHVAPKERYRYSDRYLQLLRSSGALYWETE